MPANHGSNAAPAVSLQRLCSLAARLVGAPICTITLLDQERGWVEAEIGVEGHQTVRACNIGEHRKITPEGLIVPDALHPGAEGLSDVIGDPSVRSFVALPLNSPEGVRVGTFAVADRVPRHFTGPELVLLREFADIAAGEIEAVASRHSALKLKEEQRRAEQTALSGTWELDIATGAMIWSEGEFRLLGFEPGSVEPSEELFLARVHPEDRDRVRDNLNRRKQHEGLGQRECRIVVPDGVRWIAGRGEVLVDSRGRKRLVGSHVDITETRRMEAELKASEERYRALIDANTAAVWRADPEGLVIESSGWGEFSSRPPEECLSSGWVSDVHPADLAHVQAEWAASLQRQDTYQLEYRIRASDGGYRWILSRGIPLLNADGTVREWIGTVSDIHESREAAERMRASEERLSLALQAGQMVAWEISSDTGEVTCSANAVAILGCAIEKLADFVQHIHADDLDAARHLIGPNLDNQSSVSFRFHKPDGQIIWLCARGRRLGFANGSQKIVGVLSDITAEKQSEDRLFYMANHDSLTDLPNRGYFQVQLERELARAEAAGCHVGLFIVDLDHFKEVNDSRGHEAGDFLLRVAALNLQSVLGPGDMVARLGGDEFAVIVSSRKSHDDVIAVADKLLAELRTPISHAGEFMSCHASIGIAIFPEHDRSVTELMKDADLALFAAKGSGRNQYALYSPQLRASSEQRQAVAANVRQALLEDRIMPFYQPIIGVADGRIRGFEALLRWNHPTQGILTPAPIASAFDNPELALDLGARMLDKVVTDANTWLQAGVEFGRLALNVSSAEFSRPDLATRILAKLAAADLPPTRFGVEVTETVLLDQNRENVLSNLLLLRQHGVQIAMDDFGTGFASLSHLKQFPVDRIKIDRSFVQNLEASDDDSAIVSAVISLSASLRLQVVAEGVETGAQLEFLQARTCCCAQGFLFAKAMSGTRLPRFIADWYQNDRSRFFGAAEDLAAA